VTVLLREDDEHTTRRQDRHQRDTAEPLQEPLPARNLRRGAWRRRLCTRACTAGQQLKLLEPDATYHLASNAALRPMRHSHRSECWYLLQPGLASQRSWPRVRQQASRGGTDWQNLHQVSRGEQGGRIYALMVPCIDMYGFEGWGGRWDARGGELEQFAGEKKGRACLAPK